MEEDAARELAKSYMLTQQENVRLTNGFNNALKIIAKYRDDLNLVKLSDKDLRSWVMGE